MSLFSLVAKDLIARKMNYVELLCDHEWTVKGQPLTPNTWYECSKCGKQKERG
jgi:hypothetical protein